MSSSSSYSSSAVGIAKIDNDLVTVSNRLLEIANNELDEQFRRALVQGELEVVQQALAKAFIIFNRPAGVPTRTEPSADPSSAAAAAVVGGGAVADVVIVPQTKRMRIPGLISKPVGNVVPESKITVGEFELQWTTLYEFAKRVLEGANRSADRNLARWNSIDKNARPCLELISGLIDRNTRIVADLVSEFTENRPISLEELILVDSAGIGEIAKSFRAVLSTTVSRYVLLELIHSAVRQVSKPTYERVLGEIRGLLAQLNSFSLQRPQIGEAWKIDREEG